MGGYFVEFYKKVCGSMFLPINCPLFPPCSMNNVNINNLCLCGGQLFTKSMLSSNVNFFEVDFQQSHFTVEKTKA